MPPQQNKTAQQIVADLLKRLGEITERMGSMGASMGELFRAFKTLQEMVVRATFSLVSLVGGLPRFVKGDLHYALAGHRARGGSHTPPSGAPSGEGSDGGKKEYVGHEELMRQAAERHAQKMKFKEDEHKVDEEYWTKTKKRIEEEKSLDALRNKATKASYKNAAEQKEAEKRNVPQVGPKTNPIAGDALFNRKAAKARERALAAGIGPERLPDHNPMDPDYRKWVEADHQTHTAAATGTGAPATVAAPAAPATPKFPTVHPPRPFKDFIASAHKVLKKTFSAETGGPIEGLVVKSFHGVAAAAQGLMRTFLGTSTALQGLLQAASPDTFDTFTGSLKLLAAVVGASLIPFFLQLAEGIQAAAFAFHDWSAAQKEGLGTLLKNVIILIAFAAAISTATALLTALLTPIGLVTAGLSLLALWLMNRYEARADKQAKDNAADAKDEVRNTAATAAQHGFKSEREAFQAARDTAAKDVKAQQEDIDKENPSSWWNPVGWGLDAASGHGRRAAQKAKSQALVDAYDVELGNKKEGEGKLFQLAAAFSTFKGQAQYSDVAGAYKRTQLAALADDPLTQLIKRIQAENLKQMCDDLKDIKGFGSDVADAVRGIAGAFGAK